MDDLVFIIPSTKASYKRLKAQYREESSDASPLIGFIIPAEEADDYPGYVFQIPYEEYGLDCIEEFRLAYWDGDIIFDYELEPKQLAKLRVLFTLLYASES